MLQQEKTFAFRKESMLPKLDYPFFAHWNPKENELLSDAVK